MHSSCGRRSLCVPPLRKCLSVQPLRSIVIVLGVIGRKGKHTTRVWKCATQRSSAAVINRLRLLASLSHSIRSMTSHRDLYDRFFLCFFFSTSIPAPCTSSIMFIGDSESSLLNPDVDRKHLKLRIRITIIHTDTVSFVSHNTYYESDNNLKLTPSPIISRRS